MIDYSVDPLVDIISKLILIYLQPSSFCIRFFLFCFFLLCFQFCQCVLFHHFSSDCIANLCSVKYKFFFVNYHVVVIFCLFENAFIIFGVTNCSLVNVTSCCLSHNLDLNSLISSFVFTINYNFLSKIITNVHILFTEDNLFSKSLVFFLVLL